MVNTLTAGIEVRGRNRSYHAKGIWAVKNKKVTAKKAAAKSVDKVKQIGGKKNGKERTIHPKGARFINTEPRKRALPSHKRSKTAKLRSSITPGTVLIVLAGRYAGKRVIFLKQLASGLLLITGPFKINGVPLRRLSQAYVIATQTKVDISGVKIPDEVNDAFFKKTKVAKKKNAEGAFFADEEAEAKAKELKPSRVAAQKSVDKGVIAAVKKTAQLDKYLKAHFRLTNGQYPHQMVF